MDLKIALLVGLVVGLILLIIGPWPSTAPILVPAAEIAIEDATWQWTIALQGSSDLILEAASALPRIRTGHAATASLVSPLAPSTELVEITANASPRIVVGHAATTSAISIGIEAAAIVTTDPRILVEPAATVLPLAPVAESELLAEDAQRVTRKLVIEDAETVDIHTLKPMPSR